MANQHIQKWINERPDPLPAEMDGMVADSWSQFSITERLPEIGRRIILENEFPEVIVGKIQELISEIHYSTIMPLSSGSAPDLQKWNAMIGRYLTKNWLNVPWFFAEFYFYRRVLDTFGYFANETYSHYDPYHLQKQSGLEKAINPVGQLFEYLDHLRVTATSKEFFQQVFLADLVGNHMDLSLWPVASGENSEEKFAADHFFSQLQLVINDIEPLYNWFCHHSARKVDFLIDNAGFEFLCDLYLADFLLDNLDVEQITLHIKPYPIFVSDVVMADVKHTLERLEMAQNKGLRAFAQRIHNAFIQQKIVLSNDLFWGLPVPMWNMPGRLYQSFLDADLLISKGDANFRRLVGDLAWNFEQPLVDVIGYLPSPVFMIRVLKSEVGAGFPRGFTKEAFLKDPKWMYSGQWGSLQFFSPKE